MILAVIPFFEELGRVAFHKLGRCAHDLTGTFKTRRASLDLEVFLPVRSQFLYELEAALNNFLLFLHEISVFFWHAQKTLPLCRRGYLLHVRLYKLSKLFTEIAVALVKSTDG